jgi:hypothetical protein
MVELYLHSPMRLHGIVLNKLSTWTTLSFFFYLLFEQIRGQLIGRNIHTSCTLRSNSYSCNVTSGCRARFGGNRTLVRAQKRNCARDLTWLARLLIAFRARCALQ